MSACMSYKYALVMVMLLFHMAALVSSQTNKNSQRKLVIVPESERGGYYKIIVVTYAESGLISNCEVITDRKDMNEILENARESEIRKADQEEFEADEEDCNTISSENKRQPDDTGRPTEAPMEAPGKQQTTTEGYEGWNVIFPGTKWCGAGDIAKSYDDLGSLPDTDKCCRAHDNCNDTLAPGTTKNNLTNESPFTKLSCKCDDDFYDCLDRVDSVISNKIGNLYFNILRRDCYKADYPVTKKCKKFRSFLKITCKEYEKDTKASKVYQWVKPKTYKKLPIPGPLTITLPF